MQVKTWKVQSLGCIEHNANDGLKASKEGIIHAILVSVLAGMMEKAGEYRFILHFLDDHPDKYKDHKVKPALELNQIHNWHPITYHDHNSEPYIGKYAESQWHVAWCRAPNMVSKRTELHSGGTLVIDRIRALTVDYSGMVAAGVNGGFFYDLSIIGEVGTDSGWQGEPMDKCRWAFGMRKHGWDYIIERMVPAGGGKYTAPGSVKNYPYGLSGIGALVRKGKAFLYGDGDDSEFDDDLDGKVDEDPKNEVDNDGDGRVDEDPPWPDVSAKRPHTALAWGLRKGKPTYFFLIAAESWIWNETVEFCQNKLPEIVKNKYPRSPKIWISIGGAVMLDGGSSVKFLWRHAPIDRVPEEGPKGGYQATTRTVLTCVIAEAVWKRCDK